MTHRFHRSSIGKKAGIALTVLLAVAGGAFAMTPETKYVKQEHYRWRNDDGPEATATWKAAVDAAYTGASRKQNVRLRFALSVTGYHSAFKAPYVYGCTGEKTLQYATSPSGPWANVPETGELEAFRMADASGYSDAQSTTSLIGGIGAWRAAGQCVEAPHNTFSSDAWTESDTYINTEYCIQATAKAMPNQTYYFRTYTVVTQFQETDPAWAGRMQYLAVPQLTMTSLASTEPPVIVSATSVSGQQGVALTNTLLATGAEPISFSVSGLPGGLSFSGRTISGTPTQPGTFNVALSASNANGSNNKNLVLTIAPADLPRITSAPSASAQVGRMFSYLVTAAGTEPVTVSVAGLIAGLTYNPTSRQIAGSPSDGTAGVHGITLSASSPFGSDTKTLTLTVTVPTDLVIDQDDAGDNPSGQFLYSDDAGSSFSPQWCTSQGTNQYGATSLFSIPSPYDENYIPWFKWMPDIPVAGQYDVYAWWTYAPIRSTKAEYIVTHAGGQSTVYMNQRDPSLAGKWNLLGTYSFPAGVNNDAVKLTARNGQVCADAVRIVRH